MTTNEERTITLFTSALDDDSIVVMDIFLNGLRLDSPRESTPRASLAGA